MMCKAQRPGDKTQQVCLLYYQTGKRCSLSTSCSKEKPTSPETDPSKQMSPDNVDGIRMDFHSQSQIDLQNWLTTISCIESRVSKCIQKSQQSQQKRCGKWESPKLLSQHIVSLHKQIPNQFLDTSPWHHLNQRFLRAVNSLKPLLSTKEKKILQKDYGFDDCTTTFSPKMLNYSRLPRNGGRSAQSRDNGT